MTTIRTQLTHLEDARRWRFEPTETIQETNVQKAIERAAASPTTISATSVDASSSPYSVLATDTVILVDTSGGAVTINLQPASYRLGLPLEIYDDTGDADSNAITVTPDAADTGGIDGLATLPIVAKFGGYRLLPGVLKYKILT